MWLYKREDRPDIVDAITKLTNWCVDSPAFWLWQQYWSLTIWNLDLQAFKVHFLLKWIDLVPRKIIKALKNITNLFEK